MSQRFVVHEHHSSRLHFDFRLEMDGVLRSWAVPKGPSMDPSDRRLAVAVEDHPLEYIYFEGIIPRDHYGAGAVVVWDTGNYEVVEKKEDKLTFILHGEKLKGEFSLVRLKGAGKEKEWLLIKHKDEFACPGWKLGTTLTPEKRASLRERIPPCETS
ncbi:MAG: DNA polymerase ligase N-terminal domain-containing protein [Candidatus Methanosuratincola sp.]|jgi:bifunctional non-homologous end joining protein LigD